MANPRLNERQLTKAWALIEKTRSELKRLSRTNGKLLFAYRRKVYKELMHDERGKPMQRRRLKKIMWEKQGHKCDECGKPLKRVGAELDRRFASKGYIASNVRLLHHACHSKDQAKKSYS